MNKLIVFPLFFMFLISMFSFFYGNSFVFGTNALVDLGQSGISTDDGVSYYNDVDGHHVCRVDNGSAYDEAGIVVHDTTGNTPDIMWVNETGSFKIGDVRTLSGVGELNLGTVYGILAVVIGIMALACVVSLRFFGTGLSDVGVDAYFKGTSYLTLWMLFSAMSLVVLLQIPYFGVILYFGLTLMYTLGMIGSIGGGSGGSGD